MSIPDRPGTFFSRIMLYRQSIPPLPQRRCHICSPMVQEMRGAAALPGSRAAEPDGSAYLLPTIIELPPDNG